MQRGTSLRGPLMRQDIFIEIRRQVKKSGLCKVLLTQLRRNDVLRIVALRMRGQYAANRL